MSECMGDPYAAQLRAAKAEGELARIKDELREFAEDNGLNPEMEPRDLLAKATGSFRSCAAMSDARYEEIRELKAEMEAMRPRLMPEGYEWSDVFSVAVDFFEAMHDLLYGFSGEEHTAPEMVRDVVARLMPEGFVWPRYSTGEKVMLGGQIDTSQGGGELCGIEFSSCGMCTLSTEGINGEERITIDLENGERVNRPAVLAADGETIDIGQTVFGVDDGKEFVVVNTLCSNGLVLIKCESKNGCHVYTSTEPERLTHHRPTVLAADGEPLEVGQTVWTLDNPIFECGVIGFGNGMVKLKCGPDHLLQREPSNLTHQRPVLDADGVPIKRGDTVYGTVEGGPFIVTEVSDKGSVFVDAFHDTGMHGSMFTHTRPEPPDTWERVEEDKDLNPFDYCKKVGHKLWTFDNAEEFKASDLVRRCRALAERERGE